MIGKICLYLFVEKLVSVIDKFFTITKFYAINRFFKLKYSRLIKTIIIFVEGKLTLVIKIDRLFLVLRRRHKTG